MSGLEQWSPNPLSLPISPGMCCAMSPVCHTAMRSMQLPAACDWGCSSGPLLLGDGLDTPSWAGGDSPLGLCVSGGGGESTVGMGCEGFGCGPGTGSRRLGGAGGIDNGECVQGGRAAADGRAAEGSGDRLSWEDGGALTARAWAPVPEAAATSLRSSSGQQVMVSFHSPVGSSMGRGPKDTEEGVDGMCGGVEQQGDDDEVCALGSPTLTPQASSWGMTQAHGPVPPPAAAEPDHGTSARAGAARSQTLEHLELAHGDPSTAEQELPGRSRAAAAGGQRVPVPHALCQALALLGGPADVPHTGGTGTDTAGFGDCESPPAVSDQLGAGHLGTGAQADTGGCVPDAMPCLRQLGGELDAVWCGARARVGSPRRTTGEWSWGSELNVGPPGLAAGGDGIGDAAVLAGGAAEDVGAAGEVDGGLVGGRVEGQGARDPAGGAGPVAAAGSLLQVADGGCAAPSVLVHDLQVRVCACAGCNSDGMCSGVLVPVAGRPLHALYCSCSLAHCSASARKQHACLHDGRDALRGCNLKLTPAGL